MSLRKDIPDQYIEIEGLQIRYIEHGEGRPLLCIHGMGFVLSADQFLPHIDQLGQIAHVYALDLPGWGYSDDPNDDDLFPLWVRVVKQFCEMKGLKDFDIFGYSIGGWVSCLYAKDNQDQIRRMILLDAPGLNLVAPAFVSNFNMPDRDSVHGTLVEHMGDMITPEVGDDVYKHLTRAGHEDAFRKLSQYVGNNDIRQQNGLHSVFPQLEMPLLLAQMDNAGAVLIRYIFEAYQLTPNARVYIYYGGTKRLVGGIVKSMEETAIEFLTASEVPPPPRK